MLPAWDALGIEMGEAFIAVYLQGAMDANPRQSWGPNKRDRALRRQQGSRHGKRRTCIADRKLPLRAQALAFGYLTDRILDPLLTNTDYMTRQFTRKLREFIGLGGDPALSRAIQARVERSVDLFAACAVAVLCHNDFHEGNVPVDHGAEGWRVNGVVDAENAVAADPMLAKTEYYSVQRDDTKLDALLAGYGSRPENIACITLLSCRTGSRRSASTGTLPESRPIWTTAPAGRGLVTILRCRRETRAAALLKIRTAQYPRPPGSQEGGR